MTAPTGRGVRKGYSRIISNVESRTYNIKITATDLIANSAVMDTIGMRVIDFCGELAGAITTINAALALAGIVSAAKDYYQDAALDFVTEYTPVVAAMESTRDWVMANYPKAGNGSLRVVSFTAEGYKQNFSVTPAQTSGLRAGLTTLVNTID